MKRDKTCKAKGLTFAFDFCVTCQHRIAGTVNLMVMMRTILGAIVILLAMPAVCPQAPAGNDQIFLYRGADRDARLVEGAKREGSLVLYTSLAPSESRPLADAFEKK